MAAGKKYYWLRLDRNFFKRHDIRIIENMENGKEYVLFYMKILLESIDHEGTLRFNEIIPYNDSMLATITNTNIDIVRSAVKLFKSLNLMEVLDDQTIYITETKKMLGESKSTDRVRRFREKQKQLAIETECNVTETLHETEIEIEKDIEKDIEIESDIEKEIKIKPKKDIKHKYGAYAHVLLSDKELDRLNAEYGVDKTQKAIIYLDEAIEMKGYKYKNHNLALRKWVFDALKEKRNKNQTRQSTTDFYDDMKEWAAEHDGE